MAPSIACDETVSASSYNIWRVYDFIERSSKIVSITYFLETLTKVVDLQ